MKNPKKLPELTKKQKARWESAKKRLDEIIADDQKWEVFLEQMDAHCIEIAKHKNARENAKSEDGFYRSYLTALVLNYNMQCVCDTGCDFNRRQRPGYKRFQKRKLYDCDWEKTKGNELAEYTCAFLEPKERISDEILFYQKFFEIITDKSPLGKREGNFYKEVTKNVEKFFGQFCEAATANSAKQTPKNLVLPVLRETREIHLNFLLSIAEPKYYEAKEILNVLEKCTEGKQNAGELYLNNNPTWKKAYKELSKEIVEISPDRTKAPEWLDVEKNICLNYYFDYTKP